MNVLRNVCTVFVYMDFSKQRFGQVWLFNTSKISFTTKFYIAHAIELFFFSLKKKFPPQGGLELFM